MNTQTQLQDLDIGKFTRNEYLAVVRSQLANERTGLAYARTALMLFATGVTFIKLFSIESVWGVLGVVLLALSLIVALVGAWSYFTSHNRINDFRSDSGSKANSIARFFRRLENISAAVAFAEAGERKTALEFMRGDGVVTLAIVGDAASMGKTIKRAATLAEQRNDELLIWKDDNIPFQEIIRTVGENFGSSVGLSIESVPKEEDVHSLNRRLGSLPLRTIVLDRWARRHWIGRFLTRHVEDLPMAIVSTESSEEADTSRTQEMRA